MKGFAMMQTLLFVMRAGLAGMMMMMSVRSVHAQIANFENLTFPGTNQFVNNTPFTSSGANYNNNYSVSPPFESWSGFSYSKVKDNLTPGFGNQYAAYALASPGAGAGGSEVYAVAYDGSPFDIAPVITLPVNTRPTSVSVTNTTYAALAMRDGDGFTKKYGGLTGHDPDYFKLIITGRDGANVPTGSIEIFLADYRFANNAQDYIVNQWTDISLGSLSDSTRTLHFSFDSTDIGTFGINTPLTAAVDNLAFTPIPEPGLAILFAAAIFCLHAPRRTD